MDGLAVITPATDETQNVETKLFFMKVELKEREVYGKVLLYPKNINACIFADLIGKKTFDQLDLFHIQQLGYEVEIIKL